jgi:hypothetical protein
MIKTFSISPMIYRSMGEVGRLVIGDTNFNDLVTGVGTDAGTPMYNEFDEFAVYSVAYRIGHGVSDWEWIYRGILIFDTTSLPNDIRIDDARIRIYGYLKYNDFVGATPTLNIYSVNTNLMTNVVKEDYTAFGTTPFISDLTYADMSVAGNYNDLVLNDAGKAYINKGAPTKFGLRESTYDFKNTAPPSGGGLEETLWVYFNEWRKQYFGDAESPKLIITYSSIQTMLI